MSQDADPRVRGRRVALAPGPKVETVEFFKRLHHGLHQGSVKVIPVRFFMSALIQVGPHKIVIRNAQNSAIRSKEYRFVGVVKGCHIVEPFPERAAEVAQTWFLSNACKLQGQQAYIMAGEPTPSLFRQHLKCLP